MSWPVRIISSPDSVPKMRWKRWLWGVGVLLFCIIFGCGVVETLDGLPSSHLIELLLPLSTVFISGYLFFFALRIYYYGVCLSAHDRYLHDAQVLQNQWTEWANRPLYVSANHFLLPEKLVVRDIMMGKSTNVVKGQALRLDVDGAYTEEELFNELLSSIRIKIKKISSTHVFDVIFTYEKNHTSFSVFRESWCAAGLDDKIIDNCYFFKCSHEQVYEHVLSSEDNRVFIVISINVDSQKRIEAGTTEFASIILMSKKYSALDNKGCGVMLRPMECGKHEVENKFAHMQAYQSEVLNAARVLFSHLEQTEIINISTVLRNSISVRMSDWEFESHDLNMVIGNLSGEHFWLALSLSLYFSEIKKESSLIINGVGDRVVFNLIKPFDDLKESVN